MKYRSSFLSFLTVSAASLLALPSLPAIALADQQEDDFAKHMIEGINYFKAGDSDPAQYNKAIEAFKTANDIKPNPDAVYNIARSYHKLNNCPKALEYYRLYVTQTSGQDAESVQNYISELSTQCETRGTLQLRCAPASTTVSIDGAPPSACIPSQNIAPGSHTLSFSAPGFEPESRTVFIEANAQRIVPVIVELHQIPQVAQPQPAQPNYYPPNNNTYNSPSTASYPTNNPSYHPNYPPNPTTPQYINRNPNNIPSPIPQNTNLAPNHPKEEVFEEGPSRIFWTGIGLSGGGLLFSVIGGIVLGCAYDELTIAKSVNEFATYYEKNDSAIKAAGAFLGIGSVAIATGITLLILDRTYFNNKDDDASPTALRFAPAVSFSPDNASAGFAMSF